MKSLLSSRYLQQFNLPVGILIAFLQRTPVLRMAVATEEFVLSSPLGAVLKSALATAASLGAVHSLAGATELSPSKPSPASATVGTSFTVAFDIIGTTSAADWWTVSGPVPPGLTFNDGMTSGRITTNEGPLVLAGTPTTAGSYTLSLVAGDPVGGESAAFSYTVNVAAGTTSPPSFTTQPQSQTVTAGASVTFTVAASGSPTFQWKKDGNNLSGATSASLALSNAQAGDAGVYTVVATNTGGSTTSAAATLAVNTVPAVTFTTQPQSKAISAGAAVTFSAAATGATSYQWRKDGVDIAGATAATLALTSVQPSDAGSYAVVATSAQASATSGIAVLLVGERSKLVNLSVRATLAAQQNLILGFVVSGGSKSLLTRAAGPALNSRFGVNGYLPDPRLTLFAADGSILTSNDDWPASLAAMFPTLGAFPFDPGSKDAAVLQAVSGPATAHAPAGATGGLQLVEVYDAGTDDGSALLNVSARNRVGTGDDILIAGFVIVGSSKKHVLIRGVGPALNSKFGVAGALSDPKVTLFTSSGTPITSNDNWSDSLASTFARLGAFDLQGGSKDAALLVALEPGVYTAQVAGADGGTGEALVEIYDADPQ